MELYFFRLSYFLTKNDFLKLQEYFVSRDYYNSYKNKNFKIEKTPKIIIEDDFLLDDDPLTRTRIEVEKEFIKDFILPGINFIQENELIDFKAALYNKSLYTKQDKEAYALYFMNELAKKEETIKSANFLSKNIQDKLLEQIKLLKSSIKRFLINPYPYLSRKIELNWSRTDIEVFFYLLKENKQFNNASDGDLGKLIDNNFKAKGKSKEYLDIVNSRKHLNDLKNGQKNIKESIKRLKKIFTNLDFYNH